MKTFRATIRRTEISTESVEFQAKDIADAAAQIQNYAKHGTRPRAFVVSRPHDQDGNATQEDVVTQPLER